MVSVNYAYEGVVIKLTPKGYFKWRGHFSNLAESINYHLNQLDMEFQLRREQGDRMDNWEIEAFRRLGVRDIKARRNFNAPFPNNKGNHESCGSYSNRSTRDIPLEHELYDTSWASSGNLL